MPDFNSIIFSETDTQVYERLVSDLPTLPGGNVFNTREGSVIHGLLQPFVVERRRVLSLLQELATSTFLLYADGEFLELRAQEAGVTRGGAMAATVTLTISGDDGTEVPAGSVFATEGNPITGDPGISFITQETGTITGGAISVSALADTTGSLGNVGADTVRLIVDAPSGVVGVTNVNPASGGVDEQSDESLRRAALQRLAAFPESGNANTYRTLALQNSDVGIADVDDLWDGNGTGMVIVGGPILPYVMPETVERLQEQFDPSVFVIAHFEGDETWTGGTSITSDPLEGAGSRQLIAGSSSSASMSMDRSMNFGPWDNVDDEIWLFLKRVSAANTLDATAALKVRFYAPGGSSVAYAEASVSEASINALSGITSRAHAKITKSAFLITNGTGTFSWGNIGGVQVTLTASASGAAQVVFDGMRIARATGGFKEGIVPIGIQVTVRSARSLQINVSALLTMAQGITVADVTPYLESSLDSFFSNVKPGATIYITDVANVFHDTPGVLTYANLLLNASSSNIVLGADQRPIMGTLSIS